MEEFENKNPVMDNSGESPTSPNDLWAENTAPQQQGPDFSELFSENIAEEVAVKQEPIQEDLSQTQPAQSEPIQTEPVQESPVQTEVSSVQPDLQAIQQEPNTETPAEPAETNTVENNVEVPENAFSKEIQHTALDNSQNAQDIATAQIAAQQKAKIEQQKLAWLKQHESKARKSGLATWILSGILLTLLLLIAGVVFAKDYVLTAIDYISSLVPSNNLNAINNPVNEENEISEIDSSNIEEDVNEDEINEDENAETVDSVQQYYEEVDTIISSESNPETKSEELKNILAEVMQIEQPDNELIQYISQAIMDLTINSEEPQNEQTENEENNEIVWNEEINNSESNEAVNLEDNESNNSEENTSIEATNNSQSTETIQEENKSEYTITHVNSEEEANWVLPAHCSDLTCYGEDKEFIECTSFKLVETLDENAHRIGNGGGCRYKDSSELVYVQFN